MVANCGGMEVGGMESGDEALVVPDHNEGTGEDGEVSLGKGSHSLIEMDGMLLPAEKVPRSRSSAVKEAGIVVSRFRCGGGGPPGQLNGDGVEVMRLWSIESMPCMGAFTWAANCDSKCFIRPSSASRCSLPAGVR